MTSTAAESKTAQLTSRIAELAPMNLLRAPAFAAELAHRWSEKHRVWHGPEHLDALLAHFSAEPAGEEREILLLAAVYHDAIYNPLRADNEEASAALLLAHATDSTHSTVRRAAEIIIASKWNTPLADSLTWKFWEADCRPLAADYPLADRMNYERAIFREYQWAPWLTYREKRAEFLRTWAQRFPQQRAGAETCLELLAGMSPRVAIYPGSFHPFHRGHLSILRQAERVFDKVIIGTAVNRQKPGATATLTQRREELQARLCFHEVVEIPALLTDFIEAYPLPISVVRGVRDGTDLEAELRYARFLAELRPGTNVVWIGCESELQHLSSSAIRELESISPSSGHRYVPQTQEIYDLLSP
jgi:pantetheine-phosphate adenylyltransferase